MKLVKLNKETNQIVTDSLRVAKHFGKNHRHILRDIDNLIAENPELIVKNGVAQNWADPSNMFVETTYIHSQNNQEYRVYLMNRDGFSLLVMGFTGKEALKFKLDFINAFNEMEKQLKEKQPSGDELILAAINELQSRIEKQKQLLMEANVTIEEQQGTIEELTPAAEKYKKYLDSDGLMLIRTVAKVIEVDFYCNEKKKFIRLGEKYLFNFLKQQGVLLRNNEPAQKNSIKYFKVKQRLIEVTGKYEPTTYVTPEGVDYIEGLVYKNLTIKQKLKRKSLFSK